MNQAGTITFTAALLKHGSWGHRGMGRHPSTMTLWIADNRRVAMIEWDIPALDTTEEIGLWFEDGVLVDYDGIMALPGEAVSMLRVYGFVVPEDME